MVSLAAIIALLVFSLSSGKATAESISEKAKGPVVMNVLRGETWEKMTMDEKVAFIWGAGHIINLEMEIMDKHPELKRDTFVSKASEAMAGIPINDIVSTVDKYYAAHPDDVDMPVIHVIWDTMIKPKIKTGIGGRPLNN